MPELLDIRDEQGNLTGETMPRPEVHRTESWHGVALVWLFDSTGRILLQRRAAHLNAFPEKWDVSVSGHLSASDKPLQTAVRELSEEIGVYVKPDELVPAGELADTFPLVYGKVHREYDYVYTVCQDVDIDKLKLQAAEVLDARWTSAEELERELADPGLAHGYSGRDRKIYQTAIDAVRKQAAAGRDPLEKP